MKITADNLLGNAKRINSQRESAQSTKDKGASERGDRADIAYKVDARLESITGDLKNVQTELSEKQLMKEGLDRALQEAGKGNDVSQMINEVKYNNKKILLDFLGGGGEKLTMQLLTAKNLELEQKISQDTQKLSRLQVESENIFASSLGDATKSGSAAGTINKLISENGAQTNVSRLNPEVVMRLIK
jgi:hypothetical protein